MKILIVSGRYFPIFNEKDQGAIEKLEQIYIKYNQNMNDNITIYSPKISKNNYDKLNFKNCEFRIIDKTSILYFFEKVVYFLKLKFFKENAVNPYIKHIVKDLKNRNQVDYFDLIIFENELDNIKYFKNATNTKTKIVLHLHNDYLHKDTQNYDDIVNSADEIWAVSEYIKGRVLEKKSNLNIKVLYNTYSKDFSNKFDENKKKELYNKYELENKFVFIFVGRVIENKGVMELIKAFIKFNEKHKDAKLLIVGQPDKNKKGKIYYKKLRNSSTENIIFTGFIEPKKLRTYYSLADVQIIPTMNGEPFGIVLLEGMYSNLKIIANDTGALKEIGKDKILYSNKSDCVNSLVEKMEILYNDKTKLPNNYYEDILNNYSEKIFCENLYNLIHNFE